MSHQVLQLSVYNPSPIRLFRRRVIMPSPQTLRQYSTIILKKKIRRSSFVPAKKKKGAPFLCVCITFAMGRMWWSKQNRWQNIFFFFFCVHWTLLFNTDDTLLYRSNSCPCRRVVFPFFWHGPAFCKVCWYSNNVNIIMLTSANRPRSTIHQTRCQSRSCDFHLEMYFHFETRNALSYDDVLLDEKFFVVE